MCINIQVIVNNKNKKATLREEQNMEEKFVTSLEEFEQLEIDYNLEYCGYSGTYFNWKWFQDDEAELAVYVKISDDSEV